MNTENSDKVARLRREADWAEEVERERKRRYGDAKNAERETSKLTEAPRPGHRWTNEETERLYDAEKAKTARREGFGGKDRQTMTIKLETFAELVIDAREKDMPLQYNHLRGGGWIAWEGQKDAHLSCAWRVQPNHGNEVLATELYDEWASRMPNALHWGNLGAADKAAWLAVARTAMANSEDSRCEYDMGERKQHD